MDNNNKNNNYYPAETAGRVMIAEIPTVSPEMTIADAEKILREKIKDFKTINYIYIADRQQKLLGVISIKEIFRQPKHKKINQIMRRDLIAAHPHTSQERVAYIALKNNIKSVPIIDKNDKFLGIVPNDTILYVIHKKTSDDFFHLAGVPHINNGFDDVLKLSVFESFKRRAPWLFIGLLGGILAAKIVGLFENTLKENLILAAFIPLIVYMSDAVGTQMEAFIIRDLAVNQKLNFMKYFLRQLHIVSIIGVLTGASLLLLAIIIYKNIMIGFVLGIALFVAIISSVLTGLIIPYFFSKLKHDPANASGPIATIVQDILSIFIYFTIASILL